MSGTTPSIDGIVISGYFRAADLGVPDRAVDPVDLGEQLLRRTDLAAVVLHHRVIVARAVVGGDAEFLSATEHLLAEHPPRTGVRPDPAHHPDRQVAAAELLPV